MRHSADLAQTRAPLRAGVVSVAVGLVALAFKAYAAWQTGSLALFADAAESVVNVVAALVATASLSPAARLRGGSSPFGHGKMEYLSAAIEGALVVLAAFVVAFESIARYGDPPVVSRLALGLGISVAATAVIALLARHLERVGRGLRAPALLVEAIHLRGDVGISLAVYAGLGAAWAGGWWALDGLLAIGVSLHILISGLRAVRHSVSGLLDEALPNEERAAIEARLGDEGPPVVGFHELRTHREGAQVYVEFHLVVSRYSLIGEAHAICERLRADLELLLPGARVTIHVEPEGSGEQRITPQLTL